MIPEQDGLSILRGGLKLIFGLIHKRIENQEQIFRAFEDIPLTFSKACEACQSYPRDEDLRSSVLDLYRVLMEEIPKLTDILLRRHKGSHVDPVMVVPSRIFKQHPQHEATVIVHSVDAVTRASTRVANRVEILLGKTVAATLHQTESIDANVRKVGMGMKLIHDQQLETAQRITAQEQRYSEKLSELAGAFDAKLEHATRRLTAEIRSIHSIQAGALPFSGEPLGYIGPSGVSPFLTLCAAPALTPSDPILLPPVSTIYSYEQLYQLADLPDSSNIECDLDEIRKLRARLSDTILGRSTYLMVTDRFRDWLDFSLGVSDLVLVEGHLDTEREGKLSSLSAFCGSFIEARKTPQFSVLYYFCGLHCHLGDHISGPQGMVRSLVSQLLRWHRDAGTPLTITIADPDCGELSSHQLPALLTLFRELIQQTPSGMTLYCLIDGISEFETTNQGWETELCEIVGFFQTIVEDLRQTSSPGPAFKVLLTASQRSITVVGQINSSDQITLSSSRVLPRSIGASFEEDFLASMATPATEHMSQQFR
ncbi:hypothetical protein B0T16DRAFT_446786 [Cercophora newfieldiana]|uniref:Nephrocystin 3-like N-terminal domain-containing protein n=1 Tax=Cercophora newfieldiana TaxID=92897 RepID=A0AA39Y8L1_9PEZI|nr:hypothetical protein B0T16DRAFT_446786 [Cercophora newfieldiana]